jgi:hypothetical protein
VPRVLKRKLMLEMESDSVRNLAPFGSNVSYEYNILLNGLSVCVKLFPFSFRGYSWESFPVQHCSVKWKIRFSG